MPLLGKPRRLVFTLLALQVICGAIACDGSELRRVEVSQSTAHAEATLDIGELIASGAVQPASAIRADDQTDGWLLRTPKGPERLRWYRNLLNAEPGEPDLTIDLKLKGVYDVYVQVRAVNGAAQDGLPMAFELRLDDGSRREVVGAKGFPDYHYDTEILACHRWPMDGRKLVLHSLGRLLMTYGYSSAGTCGSDEPTFAVLDDGRILCVVRTSTGFVPEFEKRKIAMRRYCATSRDGGRSWGDIRPLGFDDGGALNSPSAYSEFLRSSNNGKWYWIGNILPEPTHGGCDPRYPLQIAELDPKTLDIKRDTVTVIQDRPADEPPLVRYSNFRVYEERGTNDFVLLMTQGYSEKEANPVKRPTYRYRIKIPLR
jgi:hypothetical protein